MSTENLEEEGLPKNPNLNLANWKFLLSTDQYKHDAKIKSDVMELVKKDNMAPFYEELCKELEWPVDQGLLQEMKSVNEAELKKLEDVIADTEKNLGETDIRDAYLRKAEYLCTIGAKEACLTAFRVAEEKIHTIGCKLDTVFHLIRVGLFYSDNSLTVRNIDKAKTLIEEGGDWDRRNRLKVYEGLYLTSVRRFKEATQLFLEAVATFTSYELMDYKQFITYTVVLGMISLDRPVLREKVVKGAEVLEVLHGLPKVKDYLFNMYDCQYDAFFVSLAEMEQLLKYDRLLTAHYRYYVREMRIMAYSQLLQSYQSLTLDYMAQAFGVTATYIDQELSRFIAAGRLHAKIDKVRGIVETNRPDAKNYLYQATIKQGDVLLNRVQKLSRVINV